MRHFQISALFLSCQDLPTLLARTRYAVLPFLLTVLILLGSLRNVSLAQSITGFPPFGSFQSFGPDAINLGNLNAHITIPVVHKAGKGLPFNYSLNYDSTVWSIKTTTQNGQTVSKWTLLSGWSNPVFGAMSYYVYAGIPGLPQCPETSVWYTDSSGTQHQFTSVNVSTESTCGPLQATTVATDGSGYLLTLQGTDESGGTLPPKIVSLYDSSGNSIALAYPPNIADPNGNSISEGTPQNGGSAFTDTLGMNVLNISEPGTNPVTYTYTGPETTQYPNGTPETVKVNYSSYTVATNFGCSGISEYGPAANTSLVSSISLPDGTAYGVKYELTPGSQFSGTGDVTGRVAEIDLPTGGSIKYQYNGGNNGIECADGTAAGLSRTTLDGSWTYTRNTTSSTTTVQDPAGNQTAILFSTAFSTLTEVQRSIYQGTSTLLETVTTCYSATAAACTTATNGAYPPAAVTVLRQPTGVSSAQTVTYYGTLCGSVPCSFNPTEVDSYDFGATSPSQKQFITYANPGNNILTRLACIQITAGSTPASCGTITSDTASLTTYTGYDSHGNVGAINNWVSGSGSNAAWLTRGFSNYSGGLPETITDVNGQVTTITYGDCNGAFPTTVAEPLSLSTSETWDCNGGVTTSTTDVNNNKTTYSYNDPFWRLTLVNYPDGGSTSTTYNLTPLSISTSTAINSTTNLNKTSLYDALGRVSQTQLTDPLGTDYVDTTYNGLGQVYTVSNPYRSKTEGTYGLTTYTYDALGRVTQLTHPDTTDISISYYGRATSVSDEGNGNNGHKVQHISQIDGLGRLTSVCEVTSNPLVGITPTPSACSQDIGATGFLTSYSYDALGNLLTVAQGGLNQRKYSYDGLSRLTSAADPESGTIDYVYNSSGDLYQRKSPTSNQTGSIGTTTSYTYDLLHRLTSITYSHSDGSTASPGVAYYYDEPNPWGVTATNYKGRLSQTAADNFLVGSAYSYDKMGRVIGEWQCTPLDCGTSSTAFVYTYDWIGDLTSGYNNTDGITYTNTYNRVAELTSTQSSLNDSQHPGGLVQFNSYSAFGKPEQIVYGNNVTSSLGYDTRLRLYFSNQGTSYDYNIISPSNTTGYAPNGDILYANDSVNGVWSYTYDDFNRLIAGSCNTSYSCPPAAGFTYTYDRFGNRHDETVTTGSGVQPLYGYNANNQIDVSGVTYDAAGNVIASGTGIGDPFTYDDENRIVTAGYYSASYVYDAFGHRVRSTVNGQTNDFLYDLSGRTIDQLTNGTLSRSEAYAGGMHIATYANGATWFDSSDWLSTFRVRTNYVSEGSPSVVETCTSMPFGEDLGCSMSLTSEVSPLHFTGQEHDWESGNDHFAFRYYNETMARWLTPDPSGLAAVDPTNPQSWNRYAYVNSNPLSFIDPTGLACFGPQRALGLCNTAAGFGGNGAFGSNWDEFFVAFGSFWCRNGDCGWRSINNGLDFVLANLNPAPANNGQSKSPARQQCEQKAKQQYQQAKSAARTNAWNGFKIGFFTTTAVNAAAGCAIGGGVGAALGTTIAEFTGATSSFGGAAVGCFTGGVDSALNGLGPSVVVGGITGGVSYFMDYSSAKSAYNQAMKACSQIQ